MLREAIGRVAAALGNTPTVCRKSYIHPAVIDAWRVGKLVVESGSSDAPSGQRPEEAATLALLRNENALRSGRGSRVGAPNSSAPGRAGGRPRRGAGETGAL